MCRRCFVKSPVFPFKKFAGVDPILGPEMHSTGEVMGVGATFGEAYGKAMEGAGLRLPLEGKAFISVTDADKGQAVVLARRLKNLGFRSDRDLRHGQSAARGRTRMRRRFQGQRRPPEYRRPHPPGRDRADHQHAAWHASLITTNRRSAKPLCNSMCRASQRSPGPRLWSRRSQRKGRKAKSAFEVCRRYTRQSIEKSNRLPSSIPLCDLPYIAIIYN